MGFWAGIKHALNSTLGTTKFKPLDKLLTDAIINQTQTISSDEVLLLLDDFAVNVASVGTQELYHPTYLKAIRSGTIRIKGSISISGSFSTFSYKFIIYKNQDVVYSQNTEEQSIEFSVDTDIQTNDVLRLYLYIKATGGSLGKSITVKNIQICGTVKTRVFDSAQEV